MEGLVAGHFDELNDVLAEMFTKDFLNILSRTRKKKTNEQTNKRDCRRSLGE